MVFMQELPVLSEQHTPERRVPIPRGVDACCGNCGMPPPSLLRNVQSLKINFKQQAWTSLPRSVLRSKAATASEDALEKGLSGTSLGFPAHPGAFCNAPGKSRPRENISCSETRCVPVIFYLYISKHHKNKQTALFCLRGRLTHLLEHQRKASPGFKSLLSTSRCQ